MINITDTYKIAAHSLTVRKGRSILTILGIVIGVSAILIVMSIGGSAKDLIVKQIQNFGPENVFINPGKSAFDAGAMLTTTLTKEDVEALKRKENVPDAVLLNASVQTVATLSYGSETDQATIWGTGENGFLVYNIEVKEGRGIEAGDVSAKSHVAVLGKNVAKELFGADSPVGKKVKIKNDSYKIIGMFSSDMGSMFGIDDMVAVPYTTAQQYLMGIRHFHEIVVQAKSADMVPRMVNDIKRTIRDMHDIKESKEDDFTITTQDDFIETVDTILGALTTFLAFVAALSLLVGGIGVMNIMYTSVTERTREIGLRKSIGATNKNILSQFLLEAVMLTGAGGIIGILFGLLFTYISTVIGSIIAGVSFPFSFSMLGAVLGVFVSCGIGIIFGIFPARTAAQKSPMEALRYE